MPPPPTQNSKYAYGFLVHEEDNETVDFELKKVVAQSMVSSNAEKIKCAIYGYLRMRTKPLSFKEFCVIIHSIKDRNVISGKADAAHVVHILRLLIDLKLHQQWPEQ
eukprot:9617891-Karenia_brevis.AAC.1